MSKNYAQAIHKPQPAADYDAFLAGADTRSTGTSQAAEVAPAQPPAREEMRQLNTRVSKARWMKLKTFAMQNDLEMQEVIARAIDNLQV